MREPGGGATLADRFASVLHARGAPREGERWVVALSGGLDSVVLLHLLRFGDRERVPPLLAAHLDHGMRPGSHDDAAWVCGLCAAWAVPVRAERQPAAEPLRSENDARRARYAFLERARDEEGASRVLTAHTADDQAETVLHRVVRGAGTRGLSGIAEARGPGLWRPLLSFWRAELEAYASGSRLSCREDPTNERLDRARNVLRHVVLPELERSVAPGARSALVRLAARAREDEAAWRAAGELLLADLEVEGSPEGVSFSRARLLALPRELHGRLVRALAERAGAALSEGRTHAAVELVATGSSGARVELGGGFELRRDFDRLSLVPAGSPAGELAASIPDAGTGEAEALIGGRRFRVAWGRAPREGFQDVALRPRSLSFPLAVRGWRFGDRVRMPYGTKKLKKLFAERRVPRTERSALPVLVDAGDEVLWVPGVAPAEAPEGADFHVGIDGGRPL